MFSKEEILAWTFQNSSSFILQFQSNGNLLHVEFKKQEEEAEASKYRVKEDLLEKKVNFLILILRIFWLENNEDEVCRLAFSDSTPATVL